MPATFLIFLKRYLALFTINAHIAGASVVVLLIASIAGAVPLENIRVEGNKRIDASTIRSYILVKPGQDLAEGRLNRSLKNLYATGLFRDVTFDQEDGILVVTVRENPVINEVSFEGNKKLSDESLRTEVQLQSRSVYSRGKVQNDVKRLQTLYQRTGRYAALIDPKIIELPQNRVNLVFEINEGSRTDIRRILFIGNNYADDNTLRAVISTKETAWYRLLTSDDTYDPDRLAYDQELLRRYYLSQGFADFESDISLVSLSPDKSSFDIRFQVKEGKRYKVRNVDFDIKLRNLEASALEPLVEVESAEFYDYTLVEQTIDAITDKLGAMGYPFVKVEPDFTKITDKQLIDITFMVGEGPKIFVERIDIKGNVRTLDTVIRREFPIVEGDAFNADSLREAERRIRNLGFFKEVKIDAKPGSTPDQTVIDVQVEEQSTGELSFGAGFSTQESLLGDVRLRERNFLGKGQDVRVQALVSGLRTELDFGFTEPYFLGRNLSAGFDLFRTSRNFDRESSFQEERLGGALRMGYRITNNLRQNWRYGLQNVEIADVDQTASRFIRDQEGEALTSVIGHELFYDRRDNRFLPSEGYYVRLGNEFAGIGGDVNFIRNRIGTGFFTPISGKDWVLSLETDTGYVFGWGDDQVRINDRFFVGGASLRGFQIAGIGPRDLSTDDALGGKLFFTTRTELRFPLGLPEELGITGRAFVDAGSLTDAEEDDSSVDDTGSIRAAAGVGLAWRSPFGPVRIDLAQPFLREEYDVEEFFRFSFGTQF